MGALEGRDRITPVPALKAAIVVYRSELGLVYCAVSVHTLERVRTCPGLLFDNCDDRPKVRGRNIAILPCRNPRIGNKNRRLFFYHNVSNSKRAICLKDTDRIRAVVWFPVDGRRPVKKHRLCLKLRFQGLKLLENHRSMLCDEMVKIIGMDEKMN